MKSRLLVLVMLLLPFANVSAQGENDAKVRDVVGFLEYLLNTLGNPSTSTRDKDVIINQSYAKIFRDSTVQVEDDLDENRDVVTNKDIQAYLKDVEFFFRSAKFSFDWQDMEESQNVNGETFYKVSLLRNLEAITITGDTINQTIPRFIEINLDEDASDLKIASIYTNELNQDAIWKEWWSSLTLEWQSIFGRKLDLHDDPTLDQIKSLEFIDTLDLGNNTNLLDIIPLSRISGLKYLDLSNTRIEDLSPIRNLTNLKHLDISHTAITDIEGLRYANSLTVFNLSNTPVSTAEVLSRMPSLAEVNVSGTFIINFSPLTSLRNLKKLESSYTEITSFEAIDSLRSLEYLDVTGTDLTSINQLMHLSKLQLLVADSTQLLNLSGIESLSELNQISFNNTRVADLSPAVGVNSLARIYCEFTDVTQEQVLAFKEQRPSVLIIFESEYLILWWEELPAGWQSVFRNAVGMHSYAPAKEDLARMVQLTAIDISSADGISGLEPLTKLKNLNSLKANQLSITSLEALATLPDLTRIEVSDTRVDDFSPLASLKKLEILYADSVPATNLSSINNLANLKELRVDNTGISDTAVMRFSRLHPDALVIFKTESLLRWWNQLSGAWKDAFREQTELSSSPTSEELHTLIGLSSLKFSDTPLHEINALKEFIRLRDLTVSSVELKSLSPLHFLDYLQVLNVSRNPLSSLDGLSSLKELKQLDISNTPIAELGMLVPLNDLEYLNCSGTQIKNLDGLANLTRLEYLDCSNTSIKKLDEVSSISLQTLKCYNTRISSKRIDGFKQLNPECDVSYY